MKKHHLTIKTAAALGLLIGAPLVQAADTFTGFTMDFVDIGNADNAADNTGYGAVGYNYRMGKYEVSRGMIDAYSASNGESLLTMFDMTPYGGNGADRPATGLHWNEAARFVNWLNTSQGYPAAYKFTTSNTDANISLWTAGEAGYDAANPFRNSNAHYFLPSENEWYKAAFYDPTNFIYHNYATGSDTKPTGVTGGTSLGTAIRDQYLSTGPADITNAGGLSPYGTMAQNGNVWERIESGFSQPNNSASESRVIRGNNWYDEYDMSSSTRHPSVITHEGIGIGFRVASLPEPSITLGTTAQGTISGNTSPYILGANATLTASPNPGYVFTGWTGDASGMENPLSVLMDSDKTIGATFEADINDNDEDGLTNYQEIVELGTNPDVKDTDGDEVEDGDDALPLDINEWFDTDDDGTGDNADTDDDNDGLSDVEEMETYGTNPKRADSDGDGLSDPDELQTHLTNPNLADTDDDGLNDGQEVNTHGTLPLVVDTDGDGFLDGYEILTGKLPLDPLSKPAVVAETRTAIEFTFPAALGKTYRIEDSLDLETWETVESDISGNGAVIQRFYSTRNIPKRYFRVEEDAQ